MESHSNQEGRVTWLHLTLNPETRADSQERLNLHLTAAEMWGKEREKQNKGDLFSQTDIDDRREPSSMCLKRFLLLTYSFSPLSLSSSLPLFLSFSEGLLHWFIMLMINQIEAAVWESRSAWAFHFMGPDWARGSWSLFKHLLEIWDFFCLSFPPLLAFLLLYQAPFHDGKVTGTLSLSTLTFALSFPPILSSSAPSYTLIFSQDLYIQFFVTFSLCGNCFK